MRFSCCECDTVHKSQTKRESTAKDICDTEFLTQFITSECLPQSPNFYSLKKVIKF